MNLDKDGYDESGKPGPEFAQKGGALWLYRGDGSDINDQLRSGDVTEPEVRDALDAAMRPLGKDSVVYRDSKLELEPGTEFVEQGYTSTAYKKGSFGPGAVKIDVPKSAPVLRVGDYYKEDPEREIILGRGARFQVISKNHLKWIGSTKTARRGAAARHASSWGFVLDNADRHAPAVKHLALAAFGDARAVLDRVQLEMELSNKSYHGVELVMDPVLTALKTSLLATLPGVLLRTRNASATEAYRRVQALVAQPRAAAKAPVKVDQAFDVTDPAAVAWIHEHAGDLIDGISDTTRAGIRDLIETAFADQFDVYELADRISEVIGDEARAEEIARTETMTASNAGQQDAWDQAVDDGLLTGNEVQEWIVTPDDRLCPVCADLDGVQAALGDMFVSASGDQYDGAPAHPNCRCTLGLALPS